MILPDLQSSMILPYVHRLFGYIHTIETEVKAGVKAGVGASCQKTYVYFDRCLDYAGRFGIGPYTEEKIFQNASLSEAVEGRFWNLWETSSEKMVLLFCKKFQEDPEDPSLIWICKKVVQWGNETDKDAMLEKIKQLAKALYFSKEDQEDQEKIIEEDHTRGGAFHFLYSPMTEQEWIEFAEKTQTTFLNQQEMVEKLAMEILTVLTVETTEESPSIEEKAWKGLLKQWKPRLSQLLFLHENEMFATVAKIAVAVLTHIASQSEKKENFCAIIEIMKTVLEKPEELQTLINIAIEPT